MRPTSVFVCGRRAGQRACSTQAAASSPLPLPPHPRRAAFARDPGLEQKLLHYSSLQDLLYKDIKIHQLFYKDILLPTTPPPPLTFQEALEQAKTKKEPRKTLYERLFGGLETHEIMEKLEVICPYELAPNKKKAAVRLPREGYAVTHYDVDFIHQDDTADYKEHVSKYVGTQSLPRNPPRPQARKGTPISTSVPSQNGISVKFLLFQMKPRFVEYDEKFESWEDFWKCRSRELKKREIPCRDRKLILKLKQKIRIGRWVPDDEANLKPHLRGPWLKAVSQ